MRLALLAFALLLAGCAADNPVVSTGVPANLYHDPGFDSFCAANPHKGTCP